MQACNCGKHVVPTAQVVPVECEFVIPGQYPYVRPAVDSYTCCCCGNIEPAMKDYPSSGPYLGSAFALKDAMPYLIDSTYMSYGQALTFSENIYTKVTKRNDPSCINLTARFDFTDSTLTNTVRFDFLKNYTARKYEELAGVLPIIKSGIKFRIHYTIYNIDGGVEYESHVDCKVDTTHFHFTSIKDVFVQSAKGLIIENIPAMTYQGRYTITINTVDAILEIIDTKEHLQDPSLNPYYTFTDNNRKIQLHNTEISGETPDDTIVFATCDVRQSFDYIANVTTRLRIDFMAFTTLPIACGDTSPIWFALNEPTEATITQLRNEVSALEEEVAALHAKDASQDVVIEQLAGQVELNKNNIINLTSELNAEKARNDQQDQLINTLISRIDALTARVEILEAIPRALVTYKTDKEFQSAQITWKGYGNLYQATQDFVASGVFDADVASGYLIPIATSAADLTDILTRLSAVEETANTASQTASTAESAVSSMAETVGTLETNVSGLTETVGTMGETVSDHTTSIATNTADIETNTGAISGLNTVVTALNEDVDDLDERVTDLEHPIDPEKINVRKISDMSIRTFNNMTDAADYINADDAEDNEQYDLIIGPQMSHSSDTDYQKIASSKLRDVYNNGVNTTIDAEIFRDSGIEHFYWGDMSAASSISVGNMAFGGCTHLVAFDLPSPDEVSYVSLGNNVLAGCSALTSIKLDTNATTLGNTMFAGCSALKTAEIAVDVKPGMFNGSAIETVVLKPTCSEIGSGAFAATPIKTINLTQSIGDIKSQAFQGCSGLTSINIDINYDICAAAFQGCTNLSEITIGNSVRDILNQAFAYTAITTIDIPSNINTIATNAFEHTSLETINVHASEGSISGAPWGATGATVNWIGE